MSFFLLHIKFEFLHILKKNIHLKALNKKTGFNLKKKTSEFIYLYCIIYCTYIAFFLKLTIVVGRNKYWYKII